MLKRLLLGFAIILGTTYTRHDSKSFTLVELLVSAAVVETLYVVVGFDEVPCEDISP